MGKLTVFKQKIMAVIIFVSIISMAGVFSLILGKYFLDNVVRGYPVTRPVYRTVYYPVTVKSIRLEPVSLYTLQAGVFTDRLGAVQFSNELIEKGLRPFITPIPPYKVYIFAAPSREKLERFKAYSPPEAFVVNEIVNDEEITIRSDKKYWLEFLPRFTELYAETLNIICDAGSMRDEDLKKAWTEMASEMRQAAKVEKNGVKEINILAEDLEKLAQVLSLNRNTIQSMGECGQILLKIKYDYKIVSQFLSKFD